MKKTIFHIDVNSAFLSWSAVKQLSDGSQIDIRKLPSVVGGSEKTRKGIVLASSIPAKKLGIKTGETLYSAKQKCPSLMVVPPDFSVYEHFSDFFYKICNNYSPVLQKFSIDELFLDYTNMEDHFGTAEEGAKKISNDIKNNLGFTVNIGISSNKLLAKMASDFEKPDKIHTLFPDEIEKKMWPLPVGDLLMVGKKTAEKLISIGIDTIGKLAQTDINILKGILNSHGELIYYYANGIDASAVCNISLPSKSISNGSTFPYDVKSESELLCFMLSICEKTASRLRQQSFSCSVVELSLKYSDFSFLSHQKKLSMPTFSTMEIFHVAKELFFEIWNREKPVRALTVGLSSLTSYENIQCSFFNKDKSKNEAIDKTVDSLRNRYGYYCVTRGTLLTCKFNRNILKIQNPKLNSHL